MNRAMKAEQDPHLDSFLEMLAAERAAAAHTLAAYGGDLAEFAAWMRNRGAAVAQASTEDVRACVRRLARAVIGIWIGHSNHLHTPPLHSGSLIALENLDDPVPVARPVQPALQARAAPQHLHP